MTRVPSSDEPGGFGPFGPGGDMLLPSEEAAVRRRAAADSNLGRRALRRTGKAVARRVDELFGAGGPAFTVLANAHAASTAGDTLIAIALANTLFFTVPSSEARGNVALYLLLTVAPFAVIGPLLGWVLDRPGAERLTLVASSGIRIVAAVLLVGLADTIWLFPIAFLLLVLSRVHGIARSALLPLALDNAVALVTANARLAQVGVLAGALIAPLGAGLAAIAPAPVLVIAAIAFAVATWQSSILPLVTARDAAAQQPADAEHPGQAAASPANDPFHEHFDADPFTPAAPAVGPPSPWGGPATQLRLARLATAVVRLLNGFLVLLLAFAFRDVDAPLADFGAVLGAAGAGYALAAFAAPRLERTLREEPMVVAALAVEAAAAFVAGQFFGLPAAAFLSLAAGYAWGTAKFGFDGLLQATVEPAARGRAFTRSETVFQLAWVGGAVLPTAITVEVHIGLLVAGVVALLAQTIYVSRLLQRFR